MRTQLRHAMSLVLTLLLVQASWLPRSSFAQGKTPSPEPPVDPKTTKEVLAMEAKFALAVEKRDADALDKLLADNYTDSYEGGIRAINKLGAIAIAKGDGLSLYRIEKEQHLSRRGGNILVEGLTRDKRDLITDIETEIHWGRVQRLWTKKEGGWQLLGQLRPAIRDEHGAK